MARLAVGWAGLGVILHLSMATGAAQFDNDWRDPAVLELLKAKSVESEVVVRSVGDNAGLFYDDEPVEVILASPRESKDLQGATIEMVAIDTRSPGRGATGFVADKQNPQLFRSDVQPARVAIDTAKAVKNGISVELPLSRNFGLYALILDRPERGRTLLGAVARVHRPATRKGEYPQIMAEFTPRGSPSVLSDSERAARVLHRLGVGLIRAEAGWKLERTQGAIDWASFDPLMTAMSGQGIRVLVTMGSHPNWSLPFGEPTPAVNPRKMDEVCHPKFDVLFGKFVRAFAKRYWQGGDRGLWAIEHWNEPWEPNSISGWQSDSNRYRALLAVLSERAKSAAPGVKIFAASSVMNTEDKLLSTGGTENLKYLDGFSDHYVSPVSAYGPALAKAHDKVSIETETWGARSEVLLPQFMTQFLAVGQRLINPCISDALFQQIGDVWMPKSAAIGVSAWNAVIADRPFNQVVFREHQPWLFQFGPDEDAVFVLYGKQLPLASANPRDITWPQTSLGLDGTLLIADPKASMVVMDCAGNVLSPGPDGTYRLTMNATTFYLRSDQGARHVADTIRAGKLTGLRQVEILPGSVQTRPMPGRPAVLEVALHHLRNAPTNGTFKAELLSSDRTAAYEQPLTLRAGETISVRVPIAAMLPAGLPMRFTFTSDQGTDAWTETIQTSVIPRATLPPDAPAEKWDEIPAVHVVRPAGEQRNVMEDAWLPFVQRDDKPVSVRHAELRMAWDASFLYVFARADGIDFTPKQRLATWDEEQYFHATDSAKMDDRYKAFADKHGIDFKDAFYVYRKGFGSESPFNGDVFQIGLDVDAANERYQRTHDIEFPRDKLPGGFHVVPDTDYEFSLYPCVGGGSELWCLLSPGMPRTHYFPRQARGAIRQHAVEGTQHNVQWSDGRRVYHAAIPWSAIGITKPTAGMNVGVTFRFNSTKDGVISDGTDSSSKNNTLSLHPYYASKPANTRRWVLSD